MFEAMSNRGLVSTASIGLAGVIVLSSCTSPEKNETKQEPPPAYSGLTTFCNDLEYRALEEEFGVADPWAPQADLEGWIEAVQEPPVLHCERSYFSDNDRRTADLRYSVILGHEDPYGLDLPEETAPWRDPAIVYPWGNEENPEAELTSVEVEQGLISKGQSEQPGQSNFESITYVAYQAGLLGATWNPDGPGEVIFAWYEEENLLIDFKLRATDVLYDTSPDPEHLLGILTDTAEEIREQLEYIPTEE